MNQRDLTILTFTTIILWIISSYWLVNLPDTASIQSIFPLRFIQISTALFSIVYLAGATITTLLEISARRSFVGQLHLLLSFANAIFIVPAIVLALVLLTGEIKHNLIYSVYLILLLIHPLLNSQFTHQSKVMTMSAIYRRVIRDPLFIIALLIYAAVFALTITRYFHLPALDTYSWTIAYEKVSLTNKLDLSTGLSRTLFSVTTQILNDTTKISVYNLFKYVYPFITLLMLPALSLIAQTVSPRLARLLIMLAPLAAPVLTIELETTRQQVMAIFYLLATAAILLEAKRQKSIFLLSLPFIYAVLGTLYHPVFIFFTLPAALGIFSVWGPFFRRHRLLGYSVLVIFFIFARQIHLIDMLQNMYFQVNRTILNFLQFKWNLTFPYDYRNTDGFAVGWPSLMGVVKYYAYFAGPLLLGALVFIVITFIFDTRFRQQTRRYLRQPAFLPLILILAFFFSVAEPIPRFASIAYLPDRAWQFIAILSPLLVAVLLQYYLPRRPAMAPYLYIFGYGALVLGIAGSFMVSNGYAHTIPRYEWEAASWIKENLPVNRVIFSSASKNLIRYHAQSLRLHLDENLITTDDDAVLIEKIDTEVNQTPLSHPLLNDLRNKIIEIDKNIDSLVAGAQAAAQHQTFIHSQFIQSAVNEAEKTRAELSPHLQNIQKIMAQADAEQVIKAQPSLPAIYIYYAHTDERNPFIQRPYRSSFTGQRSANEFPAIERHPEIFSLLYNNSNKVKIWQVRLPPPTQP